MICSKLVEMMKLWVEGWQVTALHNSNSASIISSKFHNCSTLVVGLKITRPPEFLWYLVFFSFFVSSPINQNRTMLLLCEILGIFWNTHGYQQNQIPAQPHRFLDSLLFFLFFSFLLFPFKNRITDCSVILNHLLITLIN